MISYIIQGSVEVLETVTIKQPDIDLEVLVRQSQNLCVDQPLTFPPNCYSGTSLRHVSKGLYCL